MGKHSDKDQVSIYLSPEVHEAGRIAALRSHVTFSVLMEEALLKYLEEPSDEPQKGTEKPRP